MQGTKLDEVNTAGLLRPQRHQFNPRNSAEKHSTWYVFNCCILNSTHMSGFIPLNAGYYAVSVRRTRSNVLVVLLTVAHSRQTCGSSYMYKRVARTAHPRGTLYCLDVEWSLSSSELLLYLFLCQAGTFRAHHETN